MNTQAQENIKKFLDEKIANKNIGGIYCFYGDEEYMLDYYIDKIYDAVAKNGNPELDCAKFYGDDFDIVEFKDTVLSYPVAADFKLVVVKHPELNKIKSSLQTDIVQCLSDMGNDVCLIFKLKGFDAAKKSSSKKTAKTSKAASAKSAKKTKESKLADEINLVDFLKENAVLCEFKENPKSTLIKWIKKITASESIDISDENASYILNRAGTKMYLLKNELIKLIAYIKAENRKEVDKQDIELVIPGKSNFETEAFELSNSILNKEYGKAIEILHKHKNQKDDAVVMLGQMSRNFSDALAVNLAMSDSISDKALIARRTNMHEYKVKLITESIKPYKKPAEIIAETLDLCRICDLRLKSTSIPEYNLLENLIYEIKAVHDKNVY